ncbi:type IV toxin-antitoxin system AbiEi family antitoxin domain-containing protein [Saxibacter everestensis]|uniref:Type IV toxin-antitoxin system AbiEi family antitoxin domain-containing protein n=1 Tax=Saxibacter everestensis TaxID=2909229 RepID=A0ABY8QZL7_9MICO|nr:type IV toxin-antitoxin system AbiEi family antitoxin domain-containing protein [Brevibacteriaceae bacterium ZFBP1038]
MRAVTQFVARQPLGTIKARDLASLYANPARDVRRLQKLGLLHRLAHGYYCAVPAQYDPETWQPSIEAAAVGIATAIHGERVPILEGLSAARMHRALPRAVATAWVATPAQHRSIRLADRPGEVRFAKRDVAALDAILIETDLGPALATTPEQTVLDLAKRGPDTTLTDEAIRALLPRCDVERMTEIADAQWMKATLERLREYQ